MNGCWPRSRTPPLAKAIITCCGPLIGRTIIPRNIFSSSNGRSRPEQFDLVVVNLDSQPAQCRVHLAVKELARHDWKVRDLLGKDAYDRHGGDIEAAGLHLELPGNGAQLLRFTIA